MIDDLGAYVSWRKSSYSASQSNCVEAGRVRNDHVGVRDSKDPDGPVLRFTQEEWAAFLLAQQRRRKGRHHDQRQRLVRLVAHEHL